MFDPATLTIAGLRRQILTQHGILRDLLGALNAVAAGVMRGESDAARNLGPAVVQMTDVLLHHMWFEERALAPRLRAAAEGGPAALARLMAEHTKQRRDLTALRADAVATTDAIGLAFAAQVLVSDVLIDMDYEEVTLFAPDLLGDGTAVTPEQRARSQRV